MLKNDPANLLSAKGLEEHCPDQVATHWSNMGMPQVGETLAALIKRASDFNFSEAVPVLEITTFPASAIDFLRGDFWFDGRYVRPFMSILTHLSLPQPEQLQLQ